MLEIIKRNRLRKMRRELVLLWRRASVIYLPNHLVDTKTTEYKAYATLLQEIIDLDNTVCDK
jgi:hypothetical protein